MFGGFSGWLKLALILMATGGTALFSSCTRDGVAARQAETLTRQDVFGSARLSAAERTRHAAHCASNKDKLAAAFGISRRLTDEARKRRADDIYQFVPAFCECFVNQVEDRGSRMQVLMAMSLVEQAGMLFSQPSYGAFRRAALKAGMTDEQYDAARAEFQRISVRSAELCANHVISAGLAPNPMRGR